MFNTNNEKQSKFNNNVIIDCKFNLKKYCENNNFNQFQMTFSPQGTQNHDVNFATSSKRF